jgi:hypothetical protein
VKKCLSVRDRLHAWDLLNSRGRLDVQGTLIG